MLPRIVTIESSLRSFQYKILNNILYLNERLFKFRVVDSPLCSLCRLENESVIHLFCTCIKTKKLWKRLQSWTKDVLPCLETQMMIVGFWDNKKTEYIIINHIILIFKRYIYLKKQNEIAPSLSGLKAFIKSIEKTERLIATQKEKLDFHYTKWNILLPFIL